MISFTWRLMRFRTTATPTRRDTLIATREGPSLTAKVIATKSREAVERPSRQTRSISVVFRIETSLRDGGLTD